MEAPNQEQTQGRIHHADNESDEDWRYDGKFNCRRAARITACFRKKIAHDHSKRIIAVLVIGVANALATVMPGNSGL
jgi:hypothetical protein